MANTSTIFGTNADAFTRRLANLLRATRRERGQTLRQVVRASDGRFTRSELRRIERGTMALREDLVELVARCYGADLVAILPDRLPVRVDHGLISAGGVAASFVPRDSTSLLTAYLKLIRDLRGQRQAPFVDLRRDDVEIIADHLGESGETIVERLGALMGATRTQRTAMATLFASGAIVIGLSTSAAAMRPDHQANGAPARSGDALVLVMSQEGARSAERSSVAAIGEHLVVADDDPLTGTTDDEGAGEPDDAAAGDHSVPGDGGGAVDPIVATTLGLGDEVPAGEADDVDATEAPAMDDLRDSIGDVPPPADQVSDPDDAPFPAGETGDAGDASDQADQPAATGAADQEDDREEGPAEATTSDPDDADDRADEPAEAVPGEPDGADDPAAGPASDQPGDDADLTEDAPASDADDPADESAEAATPSQPGDDATQEPAVDESTEVEEPAEAATPAPTKAERERAKQERQAKQAELAKQREAKRAEQAKLKAEREHAKQERQAEQAELAKQREARRAEQAGPTAGQGALDRGR